MPDHPDLQAWSRYKECFRHLMGYVGSLRKAPGLNPSAIETLVRAHVQQPAYDLTYREELVRDALRTYPNGKPMFAADGMMLDEDGNRSIFDDVDE